MYFPLTDFYLIASSWKLKFPWILLWWEYAKFSPDWSCDFLLDIAPDISPYVLQQVICSCLYSWCELDVKDNNFLNSFEGSFVVVGYNFHLPELVWVCSSGPGRQLCNLFPLGFHKKLIKSNVAKYLYCKSDLSKQTHCRLFPCFL